MWAEVRTPEAAAATDVIAASEAEAQEVPEALEAAEAPAVAELQEVFDNTRFHPIRTQILLCPRL